MEGREKEVGLTNMGREGKGKKRGTSANIRRKRREEKHGEGRRDGEGGEWRGFRVRQNGGRERGSMHMGGEEERESRVCIIRREGLREWKGECVHMCVSLAEAMISQGKGEGRKGGKEGRVQEHS